MVTRAGSVRIGHNWTRPVFALLDSAFFKLLIIFCVSPSLYILCFFELLIACVNAYANFERNSEKMQIQISQNLPIIAVSAVYLCGLAGFPCISC